jgi:CRISPR-associated protein Cas1
MATLYVTEPGARIEREYRRLLVTKEDEVLLRVPLSRVSDVVLVGWTGATTPALLALLDAGIELAFVSRSGKLRGRLVPPTAKNIPLRHRQYERAVDEGFCLEIARAIVGGKLRNERTLARRLCRGHDEIEAGAIEEITSAIKQVDDALDMDTLRGLEGAGARAYFRVFREALRRGPSTSSGRRSGQALGLEWGFEKRVRRPPGDPVNAMLSLGYTLLGHNMMTALEVVGLDPYDGFFHADKYGRPALALDLVEEFRSVIVDSVVLTIVNKRMLTPDDFRPGPKGGVILRRSGLREFLGQYTARLQTEVIHPLAGRRLTYQKCFEVQARLLRKVIEGQAEEYQPFLTK